MRVGTTLLAASVFTLFALSTSSAFEIVNSGRMRQVVGPAIYVNKSSLLIPNNNNNNNNNNNSSSSSSSSSNFVAEERRKYGWHYRHRLHYDTIQQPFATSYSSSCNNNNNRREVQLHLTANNDEDYSAGKPAAETVVPKPTKYLPSIFLTTLMVFVNNKIMGASGFDHFLTKHNSDVWFSGWFSLLILTRLGCGNLMYGVVYPFFFSDDNDNCSDSIFIIPNNNNEDNNKSKLSVITRALEGLFSFGSMQYVIRFLYTTILPTLERQSLPISVVNTTTILYLLVYLVGTNVYYGRRNEIYPKAHENWTLDIMTKKFPTGWKFISHCLKADGFCEGIENIQPSIVLAIFLTYSPNSFLNLGLYTVFVVSRLYTTMIQKEEPITIDFWQFLITTLIGINLMECLAMLKLIQ